MEQSSFGKKKVVRRRRKKGSGSKPYFHDGTQNAIIAFQDEIAKLSPLREKKDKLKKIKLEIEKSKDRNKIKSLSNEKKEIERWIDKNQSNQIFIDSNKEKAKIYREHIEPAFDKLVENLIFIHNFLSLHDSYEDLKSDCVTFLYQALPKWKASKGKKAFSYFNIIAKHFLIIKSKQRINKIKKNVSFDDPDSLAESEQELLEEYCTVPSPDVQVISKEFNKEIKGLLVEIKKRLKNDSEHKTIDSIIYIFNHIDQIDLLNKRAVFFYIREMTGLSAKQLTTNMAVIKKHYRELRGDDEFGIFF